MLDRLLIAFISCVDRTLEYIRTLLRDMHGTWQLPLELIGEVAQCLLPDVVAYCESEEGKAEFANGNKNKKRARPDQPCSTLSVNLLQPSHPPG